MSWLICSDLVTAPGTNAFKKEPTTWNRLIDILATSAQSATESSTNALDGIMSRDITTLPEFARNSVDTSQSHKDMRKTSNPTRTGIKRDMMTFNLKKKNWVHPNAMDTAHTNMVTLTKRSKSLLTPAKLAKKACFHQRAMVELLEEFQLPTTVP